MKLGKGSEVRFKNRVQPHPYPMKVTAVDGDKRQVDGEGWYSLAGLIHNEEWKRLNAATDTPTEPS
jgi:hypothetical protein